MKIIYIFIIALLWSGCLFAQLCTGILGARIYFEDFGSGENFGPELPAGSTTYNYGAIGSGNYVVTNTAGLNGTLWHDAPDHTAGDVDGYMLLFDASSSTEIFFETTLANLCGNTNYVFSCFVANVVVPSACGGFSAEPNIKFEIVDPVIGTVYTSAETGDITTSAAMEWVEVGISFKTLPGKEELIVRVINNAAGGCGNDLVLDDFTLHLCNPVIEQTFDLCEQPAGEVIVGDNIYTVPGVYEDVVAADNSCNNNRVITTIIGEVVQLPAIELYFCEGDTLEWEGQLYTESYSYTDTLQFPPDCYLFQSYEIIMQEPQLLEQDLFLCIGDSLRVGDKWYFEGGTYVDSLQTFVGCDSTVITNITTAGISVDVQPLEVELELGETINMDVNVSLSTDAALNWSPAEAFSCQNCEQPRFQPFNSGTYALEAVDIPSGCADTVYVEATVLPCIGLYVPNAFSPNGDGRNDLFTFYTKSCYTYLHTFQIYDRWGGLIFTTSDQPLGPNNPVWDGRTKDKLAAPGGYVYYLRLELLDGTEEEESGVIYLMK